MPHYYLDSSAVVKCYVPEAGSRCIRQLISNQAEHLTVANPFDYAHLDQPETTQ